MVVKECRPEVEWWTCEKGDVFIREKVERGIGFPTCISVNNTVCYFSPLQGDEIMLEEGDTFQIFCMIWVAIYGFIAVVAHSHVVQEGPISGRAVDVIAAANTAAEVALRLVRPGKKTKDVTDAIQKVAAAYVCSVVGLLSHQLKQFVIDGNKAVLSGSNPETIVDDAEFEENEVYAIDIVTSIGEGKDWIT